MENTLVLIQQPLYPDDIHITFNPAFCIPLATNVQFKINELWERDLTDALRNNRILFNAITYRYHSHRLFPSSTERRAELHLDIGPLEYKDSAILSTHPDEFSSIGVELGSIPVNPLFVTSAIRTSNGKYVLIRRSDKVYKNKGKIALVSGIASKDEVELYSGRDLFRIMLTEIEEEISITKGDIDDIHITALIQRNRNEFGIVFHTQLNLTDAHVRDRFCDSSHEVAELIFVEGKDLAAYLTQYESGLTNSCVPA